MVVSSPIGPLAIGGVGGSGTRLIAEIVRQLGYYTGSDLNEQGDNQWFTLLLRRPHWYAEQVAAGGGSIGRVLEFFEKAMTGTLEPDDELRSIIDAASPEMIEQHQTTQWIERRTSSLMASSKLMPRTRQWGWKEPNSHFYLDHLHRAFGQRLRYIHVIRHGLDMAWSSNQRQLRWWGPIFGVDPAQGDDRPSASLDFWIVSNERAITLGQQLLEDRFLLINFDAFCIHPDEPMLELLDFLQLDVPRRVLHRLLQLPRVPTSMGRYRQEGLGRFTADQLTAVRSLGFSVK